MVGIVLAAGRSSRTNTEIPKVLLPLGSKTVLEHVLETCTRASLKRLLVVVGHRRELVQKALGPWSGRLEFVVQDPPRGTADAVLCCRSRLSEHDNVVVLSGDVPLIQPKTIDQLVRQHIQTDADLTLLTAHVAQPQGYGRIVRDAAGRVQEIVEEKDASHEIRKVREINVGLYAVRWGRVLNDLEQVRPSSVTGEYYLTQLVRIIADRLGVISTVTTQDQAEFMGINTLLEHRQVESQLRLRGCES